MEFPEKNRVRPQNQPGGGRESYPGVQCFQPLGAALNSCIQMSQIFYYYFIYLSSAVTACHDTEPSLYGCAALSPSGSHFPCGQALPSLPGRPSYSIRSNELVSSLRRVLYHFPFYEIPLRLNLLLCGKPIFLLVFVTPLDLIA